MLIMGRPTLHPLTRARQIVLFALVYLAMNLLVAFALPAWPLPWRVIPAAAASIVIASAVVEVVYRRWWAPKR